MAKLFIFGIGGTGSRIIKSLMMLLASGIKIEASEIIPIIVDPDRANGDLNRTVDLLRLYQRIRSTEKHQLEFEKNQFFRTKITTLNELVADGEKQVMTSEDFRMEIEGVRNERFRDFINYEHLDGANKALTALLFSEENLASDMEVGFKGNPNIGSVVLNKFHKSDEFKHFASNFAENDRIFIISSIFGGTGAAGFPLILKNIRNAPDKAWLRDAKIGAITVLPYFGVAPDEKSKIDKSTFISKTKAALSYYSRNITGNKSVNVLYHLGDNDTKDYDNQEGAAAQQNDAHFVELAGALSIIDFMAMPDSALQVVGGKAVSPIEKDFGVENAAETLNFTHLGNSVSQRLLRKPLSQFFLFHLFLEQKINTALKHPWANAGKVQIDDNFLTKPFYQDVRNFLKRYREWLTEMARNKIGFSPFNLGVGESNLLHLFNGISPKKSFLPLAKENHELFIDRLNSTGIGDLPIEQKFMASFSKATERILKDKFDF